MLKKKRNVTYLHSCMRSGGSIEKKEKEKTVRKELGNLIKQGFVKKTHFEPVH